jgi:hypothetical protein
MQQMNESGLFLREISLGRTQAIYLVESSSPVFRNTASQPILKRITFSMDSLSADGDWFISGNERLAVENKLSTEVAFSGKSSAKFFGSDIYGLLYKITDAGAGTSFRVSIRRKGDPAKTYLCAAAENTDLLYVQKGKAEETTTGGWDLIRLEFSIPVNLKVPYIKVYAWNNSGKEVFFDDLTIERIK